MQILYTENCRTPCKEIEDINKLASHPILIYQKTLYCCNISVLADGKETEQTV